MTGSGYTGLLGRWWLTLLFAALVGAGCGWLAASTMPTTYGSEVRMLVGPVNGDFDTLRASSELTRTYADLATSDEIVTRGTFEAGITTPPEVLGDAVRATANGESRIVTIRVELGSPDEAAAAANGIASALTGFTAGDTERPEGELRVINEATAAASSPATRTALIVVLAALGAVVAALFVVMAIEFLDGTVRDVDQLRRVAGDATLGLVLGKPHSRRLLPWQPPEPPDDAHHFRVLLADVVARSSRPVQSILVLSVSSAADARYVANGLAAAAASIDKGVVVIDSELGGVVFDAAPVNPETGPDGASISDLVIPATRSREESSRLAAELLERRELLIVDAGAAPESFGGAIWAGDTDAAVVGAPFGKAHREDIRQALDRLEIAGARTTWVVGMMRTVGAKDATEPAAWVPSEAGTGRADARDDLSARMGSRRIHSRGRRRRELEHETK